MIGIAEMFDEFYGRERYEFDLAVCMEAKRIRDREGYRTKQEAAGKQLRRPSAHGSAAKYRSGCRCATCKAGRAAYMRERYAAQLARAGRKPRQWKRKAA